MGSGKHCLVEDLVQRNIYDLIDGSNRGSPRREGVIALVQARNLDVDLNGHLVTGAPFNDTTGVRARSDSAYITVRNGVVRTPGPYGVGVAMAPNKDPDLHRDFEHEDLPPMDLVFHDLTPKKGAFSEPWDYQPPTHYTIDNLKIESGGRGVILAGSHNVLRNSTIEVDSPVAAYIYGPNAIIEGNTFIVHRKAGEPEGTSAALKLRDADNAIIRNNRFIIKGLFAGKAQAAINLLESHNVVIENNTADGAKAWLRKDEASTVTLRDNKLN